MDEQRHAGHGTGTGRWMWVVAAVALSVVAWVQWRASHWQIEEESARIERRMDALAQEAALRVERWVAADQAALERALSSVQSAEDVEPAFAAWADSAVVPWGEASLIPVESVRGGAQDAHGEGGYAWDAASRRFGTGSDWTAELGGLQGSPESIGSVRLAHPLLERPATFGAAFEVAGRPTAWVFAPLDVARLSDLIAEAFAESDPEYRVAVDPVQPGHEPAARGRRVALPLDSNDHMVATTEPGLNVPFGDRVRFLPGTGPYLTVVSELRRGSAAEAARRATRSTRALGWGALLLLSAALAGALVANRRATLLAERQGRFIATISHELRTPLAVVRALGENLADGVRPNDARLEDYGREMVNEADRLGRTVEAALQVARGLEPGADLRMPGESLVALVRELAVATGLDESSVHLEGRPREVLASEAVVRTSLRNVLDNAVRHGGGPDGVGLRVSFATTETCTVAVSDHGPGFGPGDGSRLLGDFVRGESAQSAGVAGLGLGLALAHRAVVSCGGRIELADRPEGGAVVTLSFPTGRGA